MTLFPLEIITPQETVFQGEVDTLTLTSLLGDLQILAGHAPMVAAIEFSHVKTGTKNHEVEYYLRQGFVTVKRDNSVVLSGFDCYKVGEVDYLTLKEYLSFVKEKLAKKQDLSKYQLDFLTQQDNSLTKMMVGVERQKPSTPKK